MHGPGYRHHVHGLGVQGLGYIGWLFAASILERFMANELLFVVREGIASGTRCVSKPLTPL